MAHRSVGTSSRGALRWLLLVLSVAVGTMLAPAVPAVASAIDREVINDPATVIGGASAEIWDRTIAHPDGVGCTREFYMSFSGLGDDVDAVEAGVTDTLLTPGATYIYSASNPRPESQPEVEGAPTPWYAPISSYSRGDGDCSESWGDRWTFVGDVITRRSPPIADISPSQVFDGEPYEVRFGGDTRDRNPFSEEVQGVKPTAPDDLAYDWDFGEFGTSVERTPIVQFPGPGTYEAFLMVTDQTGLRGSELIEFEVQPVPSEMAVTVDLPAEVEIDTEVTATVTVTNTGPIEPLFDVSFFLPEADVEEWELVGDDFVIVPGELPVGEAVSHEFTLVPRTTGEVTIEFLAEALCCEFYPVDGGAEATWNARQAGIDVEIEAPEEIDVGEEFDVVVRVRNLSGVTALTDTRLDGDGLELPPTLTLVDGPTQEPAGALDDGLAPSESVAIRHRVVSNAEVNHLVAVTASGRRPDGSQATDRATRTIGGDLLAVIMTTDPEPVELDMGEDFAPVPRDVVVTLDVRNDTTVPIANVSVPESLDASTRVVVGVEKLIRQVAGPVVDPGQDIDETQLGTIDPGETRSVTYRLEVSGDGVYVPEALVTFADPETGGTGRALGQTEVTATYPTVVKAELSFPGDEPVAPTVDAGEIATAFLTLENMSNTETVTFDRSRLKVEGAAGGGFLTDITEAYPTEYVSGQIPVPTKIELEAGDPQLTMHAYLYTEPNGGTRGTVRFEQPGEVTHPRRDPRATTPDDVRWIGGRDELRLSVRDLPVGYGDTDLLSVYGAFTIGFVEGSGRWLRNTWTGLGEMADAITSGRFGLAVGDALAQAGAFLGTLSTMDARERSAYIEQTATQVANAQDRAIEAVRAEFESHMNQVFDAYYTGNTDEFARLMGGDLATVVWEVGMMEAAASNVVRLAAESRAAQQLVNLTRVGIRSLANGAVIGRRAAHAFGYTRRMADDLASFAQRNGLNITVKPRDPAAIGLVDGRQARMKPEWIKPKTVNDLDIRFLGFPDSARASVSLRPDLATEIPDRAALQRIFEAEGFSVVTDGPLWQTLVIRHQKRLDELDEYLPDLRRRSDTWVNEPFNTVDNGLGENAGVSVPQRFEIVDVDEHPGLIELRIDGAPITSDLDILSITGPNGMPLTDQQRVEVYRHLSEIADIQHPETATWISQGDGGNYHGDFRAKRRIYEEYTSSAVDSDPALQFGADGNMYAVRFNENSVFADSENYLIHWDGGFRSRGDARPTISGDVSGYVSLQGTGDFAAGVVLAGAWTGRTRDGEDLPSTQSNDPSARTYRATPDGTVEEYVPGSGSDRSSAPRSRATGVIGHASRSIVVPAPRAGAEGGEWVPVAPETFDGRSEILVLPQTTLIEPSEPGDTVLTVFGRDQLERVATTGAPLLSIDGFFEPGQRVVIDPGGPNEELATIATVEPFTLAEPLVRPHSFDEVIAALPDAVPNGAPEADAGGPYVVDEGSTISLDGTGSSDPDGDDVALDWDLDGDGTFETTDAAPTFVGVDGPADVSVTVRACDPFDACDIDVATVGVVNAAPVIVDLDVTVDGGRASIEVAFADPGLDDTHVVTIDWGDGSIDEVAASPGADRAQLEHDYAPGTTYAGLVTVADDDGASAAAPFEVTVDAPDRPLYRIRNGDPSRGERARRIYIERDVALAAELLGVDDHDPDGDGWAVVGRTTGARDHGELANSWIDEKGVPFAATRHPRKGCLTLTPRRLDEVRKGQVRRMSQERDTADCRAAPPGADVDGDGTPDDRQDLYVVRDDGRRLFVERSVVAAEAQLGVSDWDADSDGYARYARTTGARTYGTFSGLVVDLDGVPTVFVEHRRRGCLALVPRRTDTVARGQTRRLTIHEVIGGSCTGQP